MSIKPIDMKTTILVNEDASRIREQQKAQEDGQSGHVAQNQTKDQQKFETVQQTQAGEGKVLRKEDEDAERKGGQQGSSPSRKKPHESESEPEPEEKPSDGVRGTRFDIKA